jgi:hypothetical protein
MERTGCSGKDQPVVAVTEGGRRPTGVTATTGDATADGANPLAAAPDPEVLEKPVRRQFAASYKLRILQEADRCTQPGQLGALLRREGLYSSHLNTWRRQRYDGMLNGLTPKRRGRKAKPKDPLAEEVQRLRRENERLAKELKKAETIIEFQKKLSEMLQINHPPQENNNNED